MIKRSPEEMEADRKRSNHRFDMRKKLDKVFEYASLRGMTFERKKGYPFSMAITERIYNETEGSWTHWGHRALYDCGIIEFLYKGRVETGKVSFVAKTDDLDEGMFVGEQETPVLMETQQKVVKETIESSEVVKRIISTSHVFVDDAINMLHKRMLFLSGGTK